MKKRNINIIASCIMLLGASAGVTAATTTQAAAEDVSVEFTLMVPESACTISPTTVSFGEIKDLTEANRKQLITQDIEFTCENIPENTAIKLKHDLASLGAVQIDGVHVYNNFTTMVAGYNYPVHVGVKPWTTSTPMIKDFWISSHEVSKTFTVPVEFYLDLPKIEDMKTTIMNSGSPSSPISVTVPLEVEATTS